MDKSASGVDRILLGTILLLFAIGLIMVFSASSIVAYNDYDDPYYVIKKQALWAVFGLIAMVISARIRLDWIKKLTPLLMIVSFAALIAVIAGFGVKVNGATAWIDLGIGRFQPSELAKLVFVLFVASSLATKNENIRSFKEGLAPIFLMVILAAVLIMKEPDLGSLTILVGTVFIMLITAGARLDYIGGLGLAGFLLTYYYIKNSPNHLQRVQVFLDPWSDPTGKGFQSIQSLYALGSGGLYGVGLGESTQKYLYLPEQYTDFIFAILGEELGFLGAFVVILLFIVFTWRGYRIAVKARDPYLSYLAVGLTSMIVLQALVNMAVVVGLFPVTGVTLPFISYGGTSLLFSMAGVGILLNVSRQVNLEAKSQ